jgi:hypothetical protein
MILATNQMHTAEPARREHKFKAGPCSSECEAWAGGLAIFASPQKSTINSVFLQNHPFTAFGFQPVVSAPIGAGTHFLLHRMFLHMLAVAQLATKLSGLPCYLSLGFQDDSLHVPVSQAPPRAHLSRPQLTGPQSEYLYACLVYNTLEVLLTVVSISYSINCNIDS